MRLLNRMREQVRAMVINLLTVKETAKQLGIATQTLYDWVNKRKIRFVKLGGALRFDQLDVNDFIQAHKVPALTPK